MQTDWALPSSLLVYSPWFQQENTNRKILELNNPHILNTLYCRVLPYSLYFIIIIVNILLSLIYKLNITQVYTYKNKTLIGSGTIVGFRRLHDLSNSLQIKGASEAYLYRLMIKEGRIFTTVL